MVFKSCDSGNYYNGHDAFADLKPSRIQNKDALNFSIRIHLIRIESSSS